MVNSKYEKQIEVLNSTVWENRALWPYIEEWLSNFQTEEEKDYALFLLSQLMYYSSSNIRILLRALYRDLFRYPIIEHIRKTNGNTLNEKIIENAFRIELLSTRFLGVGNPSESGVHLLYYFRQENKIPKRLFVNTDDVIMRHPDGTKSLRQDFEGAARFVFIDDICASGSQATTDTNVQRCVSELRTIKPDAHISYLMLFGMTSGINVVKQSGLYDHVQAVIELDESYKCFSETSRYFLDESHNKNRARQIAFKYGYKLMIEMCKSLNVKNEDKEKIASMHALGFGGCQLLLSMHHNTPDNTLPIIWFDEVEGVWTPIFKRYNKVYK